MQLSDVLQQIKAYLPDFEVKMERFPYNVPGRENCKYEEMDSVEYHELSEAFQDLKAEVESYALSLTGPRQLEKARVALNLIGALMGSLEVLSAYFAGGIKFRDRQMA